MLKASVKQPLSFRDLKKRGDDAKARAVQMRLDALTAIRGFPTQNLIIPNRPWSTEDIKVRGDQAKARSVELREWTAVTRCACEKLRKWLDSIHAGDSGFAPSQAGEPVGLKAQSASQG